MGRDRRAYLDTHLVDAQGNLQASITHCYSLRAGATVWLCGRPPGDARHSYVIAAGWPGDARMVVNDLDLFVVTSARKLA